MTALDKKQESEAFVASRIVNQIIEGDREAESEMAIRYHNGLVAMLYNRSKDKSLAEDVAQDTWLVVLRRVRNKELRDSSKLAAFIIQIGKNQLLMNYRSKKSKTQSIEVSADHPDHTPTPEEQLINKQSGKVIAKILNELSVKRDQDILTQFYYIGESKKTICSKFELTEPHFDRVIYRARERFKVLWERHSDD